MNVSLNQLLSSAPNVRICFVRSALQMCTNPDRFSHIRVFLSLELKVRYKHVIPSLCVLCEVHSVCSCGIGISEVQSTRW